MGKNQFCRLHLLIGAALLIALGAASNFTQAQELPQEPVRTSGAAQAQQPATSRIQTATETLPSPQFTSRQFVGPAGLTAEQLAQAAFARGRDLLAARQNLEIARGRLIQAGLRPNPILDFERTTDYLTGRTGEGNASIGVTQVFELGGKRSKRVAVMQLEYDRTVAEVRALERQAPADPRDGEEAQFEAAITERVEGGFGSGDQPVAEAKVTARITRADGKTIVAQNLAAHGEGQPGVYGVHYRFGERGDYKVIFVVQTSDERQLEADFPVAVTAAPTNWVFWGGLALLASLVGLIVMGSYLAIRQRGIPAGLAVRRAIPLAAGAVAFFAIGTAALAYFEPPSQRRAAVALPAGGEGGDDHSGAGDAALGGAGAVRTVPKESQILFGIRTAPVDERKIVSGLKVTGAVVTPPNAKAKVSPPWRAASRLMPT